MGPFSTCKSNHVRTERWPLSGEGVKERELILKMKQTLLGKQRGRRSKSVHNGRATTEVSLDLPKNHALGCSWLTSPL